MTTNPEGLRELPPLPKPWQCETAMCPNLFTAEQMREYARAALAASINPVAVNSNSIGAPPAGAVEDAAEVARAALHGFEERAADLRCFIHEGAGAITQADYGAMVTPLIGALRIIALATPAARQGGEAVTAVLHAESGFEDFDALADALTPFDAARASTPEADR